MIKLKDVSYSYIDEDQQLAIDELTLNIPNGQFVAILGPNGSGKSTIAKLLNGILLPTNGAITIDGIETNSAGNRIWEIRGNVGIVFQNPDNQIVGHTVEDDVAFGMENQGLDPSTIEQHVEDALLKVDMVKNRLTEPHFLSGGQKQKLAIAGIIAMKPKVIILDEATSMLDPASRNEILKIVKYLNKEEKITIILITHLVEEAVLADRIVVMNKGKIIADSTPNKVFQKRGLLLDIGLEVPIATEMAYRLNNNGYPFKTDIISNEELLQGLWKLL